jgi:heme oxygenase
MTPRSPRNSGLALAHLRTITRPSHDAIEGALGLLDEGLTLGAYVNALSRLYGFWRGWQPQIAFLLQDEDFTAPRRRLHLLAADLSALGVSAGRLDALPSCPLVELRDGIEGLGSLYVLEGSTLGGKVIARNVARRLGDAGGESSSYFRGYGDNTSRMWRSFLARLDEAPEADMRQIGFGALATFERLGSWLKCDAR